MTGREVRPCPKGPLVGARPCLEAAACGQCPSPEASVSRGVRWAGGGRPQPSQALVEGVWAATSRGLTGRCPWCHPRAPQGLPELGGPSGAVPLHLPSAQRPPASGSGGAHVRAHGPSPALTCPDGWRAVTKAPLWFSGSVSHDQCPLSRLSDVCGLRSSPVGPLTRGRGGPLGPGLALPLSPGALAGCSLPVVGPSLGAGVGDGRARPGLPRAKAPRTRAAWTRGAEGRAAPAPSAPCGAWGPCVPRPRPRRAAPPPGLWGRGRCGLPAQPGGGVWTQR